MITVKEKVRAKSSKSSTFIAVAAVVVAAAVVVVNFEDFELKMLLFETRLDIICQS